MSGAFLTTGDVARAMGVTINTVKAWIRRGQLEAVRLPSGHYRIPASELPRLRGTRHGKDLPARYRERLQAWREFERWRLSQPVEEFSFAEGLAWAGRMLGLAALDRTRAGPPVEDTAERVARMHLRLAHVG